MPRNQKLTTLSPAGPATIPPGGKVKSVHEAKAEFRIDFEDGSSATFRLADPGSSVAVRDRIVRSNISVIFLTTKRAGEWV